jgi:hypothetical protein
LKSPANQFNISANKTKHNLFGAGGELTRNRWEFALINFQALEVVMRLAVAFIATILMAAAPASADSPQSIAHDAILERLDTLLERVPERSSCPCNLKPSFWADPLISPNRMVHVHC